MHWLKGTGLLTMLIFAPLLAQKPAAKKADKKDDTYKCVAGPDEQCASDLWFADYQKLLALNKKYTAPQDIQDMMVGLKMRLSQQIPAGYGWDDGKKRFVKLNPTTPPAPAAKTPEKEKK